MGTTANFPHTVLLHTKQ